MTTNEPSNVRNHISLNSFGVWQLWFICSIEVFKSFSKRNGNQSTAFFSLTKSQLSNFFSLSFFLSPFHFVSLVSLYCYEWAMHWFRVYHQCYCCMLCYPQHYIHWLLWWMCAQTVNVWQHGIDLILEFTTKEKRHTHTRKVFRVFYCCSVPFTRKYLNFKLFILQLERELE